MKTKYLQIIALILTLSVLTGINVSCSGGLKVSPGMKIGNEGVDFAKKLSSQIPYRSAYSIEENNAASLIEAELKKMGYKPSVVSFVKNKQTSQNVIVNIEGNGFSVSDGTTSNAVQIRKQVIVGAHYDSKIGLDQKVKFPDYDGIQENASGVGALISIAKELLNNKKGYDIVLVFFGAGNDGFAGANAYLTAMSNESIRSCDAMYCIESIYAGDKLYAHSGLNSLASGRKYEMRRKLYEISDVAIANTIDLRFNESDLDLDVNGDKKPDVYREITITKSDYSVFDKKNIPSVFIESYDYFGSDVTEQMESKNPEFGESKGKIRGTKFDSLKLLAPVLEKDRLETRVKNTVFLIINAIEKGIYQAASN